MPTTLFVTAPDAPFKVAKDINGTVVAVISVTSGLPTNSPSMPFFDKNGGDLSSVKCIEVPPSAMAESARAGSYRRCGDEDDPGTLASDRSQTSQDVFKRLYEAIAKVVMQTAWFSTQDWLAQNKDVARRFGDAIIAGGQWGMKNPGPAAAILAKYIVGSKETTPKVRFASKLDPSQIQPVYDAGLPLQKMLPGPVKAPQRISLERKIKRPCHPELVDGPRPRLAIVAVLRQAQDDRGRYFPSQTKSGRVDRTGIELVLGTGIVDGLNAGQVGL